MTEPKREQAESYSANLSESRVPFWCDGKEQQRDQVAPKQVLRRRMLVLGLPCPVEE